MLAPKQETDVVAHAALRMMRDVGGECMVDTRRVRPAIYVGRTLLLATLRNLKVRMLNTSAKPQQIPKGALLGELKVAHVVDSTGTREETPTPEVIRVHSGDHVMEEEDVVKTLTSRLPSELTNDQYRRATELLTEFKDIFSKGPYDMGRTSLVEHTIETGNSRPVRQALRHHPMAHLDEIDRQVDEMLRHDIVEPAASPWASNVVMVRKKDGAYRLCVDYRALNAVTYKDTYPLPHIDTCLNSMDGSSWFSTLDLRSGYHNIPIREQDRDKTAFITRRGCFHYKVLPFGCTTAPSVFQRLMDMVLCGLTYATC